MHCMLKIEWDAVAGVLAAVIAIVLHLLHVIEAEVLEPRRAPAASSPGARSAPDVMVVGPRDLRRASAEFSRNAKGTWSADPVWTSLPEDVSFILADTLAGDATECLLRTELPRWVETRGWSFSAGLAKDSDQNYIAISGLF